MKTYTEEQFKKLYGTNGVAKFQQTQPEQPKEPGYLSRVGSQIKSQFNEAKDSYTNSLEGTKNPIFAGINMAKNVSGIIASPITQAPGFKQLGEGFGKVGQAIVDTKPGQATTDWLSKQASPETLGAISDTLETGLNVAAIEGTVRGGTNLYNKGKNLVNDFKAPPEPPGGGGGTPPTESPTYPNTSSNIMNRVARLKPTDATKFEQMTGKTHGQYLTETKNFGAPDKIITTEAQKFTQSMNAVDAELAKLPGTFKSAPMTEALRGLIETAKSQTSGSIRPPWYGQLVDLVNKYKTGGLNMSETNLLKRLYEKNVKLGYNKLINPDGVAKATNIDSALRRWQLAKAKELGFKNIDAMNKQTQISKFLIDKLGDQVVGQSGLNGMGLTDWIMLSGGDPTAVAGFLSKKFFSSNAVQAKIAEMLVNGDEAVNAVKPDIGQSQVPQLPAPKPGAPQSQNFTPPRMPGQRIPNELPAKNIMRQPPAEQLKLPPGTSKSQGIPIRLPEDITKYNRNYIGK